MTKPVDDIKDYGNINDDLSKDINIVNVASFRKDGPFQVANLVNKLGNGIYNENIWKGMGKTRFELVFDRVYEIAINTKDDNTALRAIKCIADIMIRIDTIYQLQEKVELLRALIYEKRNKNAIEKIEEYNMQIQGIEKLLSEISNKEDRLQ